MENTRVVVEVLANGYTVDCWKQTESNQKRVAVTIEEVATQVQLLLEVLEQEEKAKEDERCSQRW